MGLFKVNSIDLAGYVLAKIKIANHLKIQKMVYYVEAWHLAIFEESIITDEFEAWVHGPVSRVLWEKLKPYSFLYKDVQLSEASAQKYIDKLEKAVSKDQSELINDVINEYGDKTAYHLENLTHNELPWVEARKGVDASEMCTNIISKKTMLKYYKSRL